MSYYSAQILLPKLFLKFKKNNHWIDASCDKASSTVLKMYFKIWNNFLHSTDVRKGNYPAKPDLPLFSVQIFSPLKFLQHSIEVNSPFIKEQKWLELRSKPAKVNVLEKDVGQCVGWCGIFSPSTWWILIFPWKTTWNIYKPLSNFRVWN